MKIQDNELKRRLDKHCDEHNEFCEVDDNYSYFWSVDDHKWWLNYCELLDEADRLKNEVLSYIDLTEFWELSNDFVGSAEFSDYPTYLIEFCEEFLKGKK